MSLDVFDKDDGPYLQWMEQNPDGFVINTDRGTNSSYFTLHKSGCVTIKNYRSDQREGGFTAFSYIKVCSIDPKEILDWASKNRPKVLGFKTICKRCNPKPDLLSLDEIEDASEQSEGFPEGKLKERLHLSRERNSKLIKEVKNEAFKKHGKLVCECCGFDYVKTYGSLGQKFIEAHHLVPVSDLHSDGGETKKEDIALVCANCHRMLHRRRPWLSVGDLKNLTS